MPKPNNIISEEMVNQVQPYPRCQVYVPPDISENPNTVPQNYHDMVQRGMREEHTRRSTISHIFNISMILLFIGVIGGLLTHNDLLTNVCGGLFPLVIMIFFFNGVVD
jgi:hypothetical protein